MLNRKIYETSKRFLDIILAVLAIIPASLLFLFIALAIKLDSEGPVFFRQKRVGKNGKVFQLLKFRSTYRTSVDETVGWEKEEGDPYTEFGKFLRRTYLDELPQVMNILKGEMSFIGPRPERPEFVEILKRQIPNYEKRLEVRPGITGWAQINMENDASAKEAAEKLQYDLYYTEKCSLWLDLLIIFKTIFIILRRQGR